MHSRHPCLSYYRTRCSAVCCFVASLTKTPRCCCVGAGSSPRRRHLVVRQVREDEEVQGPVAAPAGTTVRRDEFGQLVEHSFLGDADDVVDDVAGREETNTAGTSDTRNSDVLRTAGSLGATDKQGSFRHPSSRSIHASGSLGPGYGPPGSGTGAGVGDTIVEVGPSARTAAARRQALEETLRQRDEALKAEEKEKNADLEGLAVHERISLERDEKARALWEKRQAEWDRFKRRMSRKLGRDEGSLVVSHAEEFREMIEEYDVIQKAIPPDQKHGSEYWMMSLRGEGTRYVAVGNIFSGLFCPVKDDDKPLSESIRRPRQAANRARKLESQRAARAQLEASGHLPGHGGDAKTWRTAPALKMAKRRLQRRIAALRPHDLDEATSQGLEIRGMDLFDWAERSIALLPETEEEDPAFGEGKDAETVNHSAGEFVAEEREPPSSSEGSGPRLQLQVMRDACTLPGDVGASLGMGADPGSPSGPALDSTAHSALSATGSSLVGAAGGGGLDAVRGWPRILFEATAGSSMEAVLRMHNSGSTALYFAWKRVDRGAIAPTGKTVRPQSAGPTGGTGVFGTTLGAGAGGLRVPGPDATVVATAAAGAGDIDGNQPRGVSRFLVPNSEGMLLPGNFVDFVITFKSPNPGVFRETWQLTTTPPANDNASIRVALRGVATVSDEGAPARQALADRLEERTKVSGVEDILRDVIDSVKTPRAPPTEEERRAKEKAAFEAENPGLFYWPPVYDALAALWKDAVNERKLPPEEGEALGDWDSSIESLLLQVESIEPPPKSPEQLEAEAKAAAAEAARKAEEEEAAKKKGKKKPKKADPAPESDTPVKPTPDELCARLRDDLRCRVVAIAAKARLPAVETDPVYGFARSVVLELAGSIPELVGAARQSKGCELPLRSYPGDVSPSADVAAELHELLNPVKRRRGSESGSGSDEDDDESDEESDMGSDDEREGKEEDIESLTPEELEARAAERAHLFVAARIGKAVDAFSDAAIAHEVAARAGALAAIGMTLSSKLSVDDIDVSGRLVVLRTDLNVELIPDMQAVPIDDGEAIDTSPGTEFVPRRPLVLTQDGVAKVRRAAATITQLLRGGASRVIVLAHRGKPDTQLYESPLAQELRKKLDSQLSALPSAEYDQHTLQHVLPTLRSAVGREGVGFVPTASASAVQAALADSASPKVLLVENVRLCPEERADESLYSLSARREHMPGGTGHLYLDRTDVRDWTPVQVGVWLQSLMPGIAAVDAWAAYVAHWSLLSTTGLDVLRMSEEDVRLRGVADAHVPTIVAGIDKLVRRAKVEFSAHLEERGWELTKAEKAERVANEAAERDSAAAKVQSLYRARAARMRVETIRAGEEDPEVRRARMEAEREAAATKLQAQARGKVAKKRVGAIKAGKKDPKLQAEKEDEAARKLQAMARQKAARGERARRARLLQQPFMRDSLARPSEDALARKAAARERAVRRVAAFSAFLSSLGDVFVNDAFDLLHTNNCSVVGTRPRAAALAAQVTSEEKHEEDGYGAIRPGDGLRVAGANLAAELRAWAPLLDPAATDAKRPVLAFIGGDDFEGKVATATHLLHVVDQLALGGLLAVAWVKVHESAAIGSTVLPATHVDFIKRLAGEAARRGVKVLAPVDFVTGDVDIAPLRARAKESRRRAALGLPPLKGPAEDDEEEAEDEDDDEEESDVDSDDEEAVAEHAARKSARQAAAAAEAARKSSQAVLAATHAAAKERLDAERLPDEDAGYEGTDTGAREHAEEIEYTGDSAEVTLVEGVPESDFALDIGPDTREAYVSAASAAGTILLVGTMGAVEATDFQNGTREIVDAMVSATKESGACTIVAGGSTAAWARQFAPGPTAVSHITEGSAAARKLLQGALLPGIAALSDR